MENKKSTKVGCQACNSSKKIKKTRNFVFIAGSLVLGFGIYGVYKLIKEIILFFF